MTDALKTPEPGVDLRRLKAEVAKLYPRGHPLREVLLGLPDSMDREEALAKMEVLVDLAYRFRPSRGT